MTMPAEGRAQAGPPPPLDPDCAEVLAELPSTLPLTIESVEELRTFLARLPQTSDEDLSLEGRYTVLSLTTEPGETGPGVPLLVCRPRSGNQAGTRRPVPVLYFVHSGGMVGGTARHGLPDALRLADHIGAAVVSVDYRLAPNTPHPGPVEDCYAGLLWLVSYAGELHLDADRLILLGGSAGGGLCAAMALMCRDRGGPPLLGQLLMGPMLDDRNNSVSAHQMAHQPMWNRQHNEAGWRALLGDQYGRDDISAYAAPARAEDLSGLPATFIDVGSTDTFRDEDVTFATRIWAAGGAAELHVWPGGFHGFDGIVPHAPLSLAANAARMAWLRRILEHAARGPTRPTAASPS